MDIDSRLQQIEALDVYLSEKNKFLLDTIKSAGWSEESLLDEMKVQCPVNPEHWVHESALSKHIEMCSWVKDGYLKEDFEKQPPCSKEFNQNTSSMVTLTIDKETQRNILIEKGLMDNNVTDPTDEIPDLPKTIDRWTVELTPEQRLAVYDYVIQEAKSYNKPKNVTLEDLMFDFEKKNEDERPKTGIEILAEQRDYKRRRQSYRAKNVHITKKSYTEVMKEVIENQTIFLAETNKPDNERPEESSSLDSTTIKVEESDVYKDKDLSRHRHFRKNKESSLDHDDNDYRRHSVKKRESEADQDDWGNRHRSTKSKDFDQGDSDDYRTSRRSRSESPKAKKRKHKHKRSRSRSRSRQHKKSHKHKHKKSRDS